MPSNAGADSSSRNAQRGRSESPAGGFPFPQRLASFDNLVALANHQERLREHAISAKKIVWRDRGEAAQELRDVWDIFEHSMRGALRAFALGYGIRASLNLVLALVRFRKLKPAQRFPVLAKALLGSDTTRFGNMLGCFVFLYKFLLNFPIVLPYTSLGPPKAITARHSSSDSLNPPMTPGIAKIVSETGLPPGKLSKHAHAHQVMIRMKTRRWQALLSGAVAGGIAILCEKQSRRSGVAQQMFVRGLQGSWNYFSKKRGFHIPNGAVWLFSICCAQIMYAFLLSPETLDKGYTNWIQMAAKCPSEAVQMVHDHARKGRYDTSLIDALLSKNYVSPANKAALIARRAAIHAPAPDYGHYGQLCEAIHPGSDTCLATFIPVFFEVARWMLPVYGTLTFMPMILFRRGAVARKPMEMFTRATIDTLRSSAFLGVFVLIYRIWLCYKRNMFDLFHGTLNLPGPLANIWISRASYWIGGFLSGLSVLIEKRQRRGELALYVLPKALESWYLKAEGRGWVMKVGPYGDVVLTAIGMGMVMDTYQNSPIHLSGLVRRILYQFVGPN